MAMRLTSELVKFDNLKKALGITFYQAIGLLEALWHFTAKNAIRGDVGRYTNQEIADWIGWERSADDLINALVNTRWLDAHSEHRIIVHDWHEHADKSVKTSLRNRKTDFVMPEKLATIPKEIIGIPIVQIGSPPGAGAGAGAGPGPGPGPQNDDDGGGDERRGIDHTETLKPFEIRLHQPILQLAINYQLRRYGSPNPNASWYRSLLTEIGTVLEVQTDATRATDTLLEACKSRPSAAMPRDASFMKIAESAGLRASRSSSKNEKPAAPSGPTKCNALQREKAKIAEAKANPVTPEQFAEIRKKAKLMAEQARRPA